MIFDKIKKLIAEFNRSIDETPDEKVRRYVETSPFRPDATSPGFEPEREEVVSPLIPVFTKQELDRSLREGGTPEYCST